MSPAALLAHRWPRRALLTAAAAVTVALVTAAAAAAATTDGDGDGDGGVWSWIELEDSHGHSIWQYDLNIHQGSAAAPGKFFWSKPIDLGWFLYRLGIAVATWMMRFTLSGGWIDVLVWPMGTINDAIIGLITRIGLPGLLLTIAAAMCALWLLRGRTALGGFELAMTLVIFVLATGLLANPMAHLIGPDGLLHQTRSLGLEAAAAISHDGPDGDSRPLEAQVSGTLVDTFVRLPHQLVNYGTILDGTECQGAYDQAVAMQPVPSTDRDPREAVRTCNEIAYEYADNPGPDQLMTLAALIPTVGFVFLLILGCSLVILAAVMLALYQVIKAVFTLAAGVLAGPARGMLWQNAADVAIALVLYVFGIVFFAGILVILQGLLTSNAADGSEISRLLGVNQVHIMATLWIVNMIILVSLFFLWSARKSIRRSSRRFAEAMASARPSGAAATRLPDQSSWKRDMAKVAAVGYGLYRLSQRRSGSSRTAQPRQVAAPPWPAAAVGPRPAVQLDRIDTHSPYPRPPGPDRGLLTTGPPQALTTGAARPLPGPPDRPQLPPGPSSGGGSPAPKPPRGGGGVGRAVAGTAARAALAAVTGGGSAAVAGAAGAVGKTAAAKAVLGKVATARQALAAASATRRATIAARVTQAAARSRPAVSAAAAAKVRAAGSLAKPIPVAVPSADAVSNAATKGVVEGLVPDPAPGQGQPLLRYRRVFRSDGQVLFVPSRPSDPPTPPLQRRAGAPLPRPRVVDLPQPRVIDLRSRRRGRDDQEDRDPGRSRPR